jgi:hypothetical protein
METLPKEAAYSVDHPHKAVLGTMRRLCGCCVVARDGAASLVLSVFILFPVIVFCTSVARDAATLAVTVVLTLLTLLVLLFAVTCDPGIVPPASVTGDWRELDEVVEEEVKGLVVRRTVCRTCRVLRPPRSGHCARCDTCVREYDHHCGVLGACVGERTFRFFALFGVCGAALAGVMFVRSVWIAAETDFAAEWPKGHRQRWHLVATLGCITYTMLGGSCLLGLGGFYTHLACRGLTQKDLHHDDNLAVAKAFRRPNPVAACCCRLFGPIPPSQV